MSKQPKIYELGLHGVCTECNGYAEVIRVPGGWIYRFFDESSTTSCVFVPFDNEFLKVEK